MNFRLIRSGLHPRISDFSTITIKYYDQEDLREETYFGLRFYGREAWQRVAGTVAGVGNGEITFSNLREWDGGL